MLNNKQFLLRFLFVFNIYGNIALAISIGLVLFSQRIENFVITIAILVLALIFFGLFFRITTLYPSKYKYYRVTLKRLERVGFEDHALSEGFHDICYRPISRQILRDIGRVHEYPRLLKKYRTREHVLHDKDD